MPRTFTVEVTVSEVCSSLSSEGMSVTIGMQTIRQGHGVTSTFSDWRIQPWAAKYPYLQNWLEVQSAS
jgi:hypothetical protein